MAVSPFVIAESIQSVVITNLSQFVSSEGANFGVGLVGWDLALAYARNNGLDYFGSVHLTSGESNTPQAFGNGMWTWTYLVRLYTKFDLSTAETCEENAIILANQFMELMFDLTARRTIISTGAVKLTASSFLDGPTTINDVVYLTSDFLLSVKQQIEG